MPNYRPGRFAKPQILRQIQRDLLIAWLQPMRAYFQKRGLNLPESGGAGRPGLPEVDYDRLAEILMDPTPDMPADLVESLYIIEEMANEAGMNLILARSAQDGWALDLGEDPTPADVAVKTWILDRGLLEDLHIGHELTRPRSFQSYSTDARPVPVFPEPSETRLARLEERLNAFYTAWKRGEGARVFPCKQDRQWWFLVRHGAPCRREAALDRGLPTTVFYRPQRHDVLIYNPKRGEIQINCCAERERRVLLRVFGSCFFDSGDFFPVTSRYTLAPLVEQGRRSLACVDVPGLERVTLTEVEFYFRRSPWKRITQKAGDIFELLERDEFEWPQAVEDIARAKFAVQFRGSKKPRYLSLVPCNRVVYSREDDRPVLEKWMEAREFMS